MPDKLRILFATTEYLPWAGGIATYLGCLAPALAARGHEVHVLWCGLNGPPEETLEQGVYVHRRPYVEIRGFYRLQRHIHAPETLLRIQIGVSTYAWQRRLGIDFDVIEIPDWGAHGWVLALFHRKPILAQLHTPWALLLGPNDIPADMDSCFASAFEHFAVHCADGISSSSALLADALRGIGWLRGKEVPVIPLPIDWRALAGVGPAHESPPTVLFVGRIERLKAPETLAEALSIIRRKIPQARAVFLGSSRGERDGLPYVDWIKKSMGDGCEFVGKVGKHELVQYLNQSRVLAAPSRYDGFSMVAVEALAAGRPVVVSSATGVARLVQEIEGGDVVPPGDPQGLALALMPFLEDAGHATKTGERARAAVQTMLDPETIVAARERIYHAAIRSFAQSRAKQSLLGPSLGFLGRLKNFKPANPRILSHEAD